MDVVHSACYNKMSSIRKKRFIDLGFLPMNDDEAPDDDIWDDTITCRKCQASIYEDSVRCPSCGWYIVQDTRLWADKPGWVRKLGLAIIFAIIAILLWPIFQGFLR